MNDRTFLDAYGRLNEEQKMAVDIIDGPVLVVAGPGTGKTELLAMRVVNILRKGDVVPRNILCLTFTENGALNMRERLLRFLGQDAYRVGIYTFHAFCNSIIGRYPEYFYNAATYSQATDLDRASVINEIFASLPHGHVLASFHPEEGYIYLKDTIDRIKHIKSGGYTPDEYRALIQRLAEKNAEINTTLAKWPLGRANIKQLAEIHQIQSELSHIHSETAQILATTLERALDQSAEIGKTEPLAEWRKKYTVKTDQQLIFKDTYNSEKINAVAEIYKKYSDEMHKLGLYDYDDMIIEVVHALRNNAVLRNELEEQYQYILVDEFQDTNEAQMSLVHAITSNVVHEGRPNVMVVGDDDQAIYKFQGAEISNIVEFRQSTYRDVTTIVLKKNYRSHKNILDLSRKVVTQGKYRLEDRYSDISKKLSQNNSSISNGKVEVHYFNSDIEEYNHVTCSIKDMLNDGIVPEDIAIIARNHRELQRILPFLDQKEIPYEYLRRANVFDEPHIAELITICEYISSISSQEERKDYLLPEILMYPYFTIPRQELYSIAIEAKEQNISWAEAIRRNQHSSVKRVHDLISELYAHATSLPLEHFIERYMDTSGFKEHYFSRSIIKNSPGTYVHFLASLKTFIEAIREWKEGEMIFAYDIFPFVTLHKQHNISLVSESPFTRSPHAIQLLTAHGSKGLEFDRVFIISAHDKHWTRSARTNKAPLPIFLHQLLTPAGDNEDDFIRLFYVAITRAKSHLSITAHEPVIRYVDPELVGTDESEGNQNVPIESHENALALVSAPYKEQESAILSRLVEHYRMPVTHMNNFLDIVQGGPLYFIEQNLLRFPQPMSAASVFGSAVHKAIAEIVMYPKMHQGATPSADHIIAVFMNDLARGRLPRNEFEKQGQRGRKLLTAYFERCLNEFSFQDKVEVNMKDEGVHVGEAILTGNIDLLRKVDDGYHVIDFKTGGEIESLDPTGLSDFEKIKLHKYKQQLIYYKLLIEGSGSYNLPVKHLSLEFVESILDHKSPVRLNYQPTIEEVGRVKSLIEIIFKRIVTLNFPDVSEYPMNYSGILQFEDDLLCEKI